MAGLTAASRLQEAGASCTVFEKSRGFGGRMATRRTNALEFDHGAQYFTARGTGFQALLQRWQTEESAAEWAPGKWVGSPGMTAPAISLAADLRVIRECRITRLVGQPGRWRLVADSAPTGMMELGQEIFDGVILAIPGPQIEPLTTPIGLRFSELDGVRYAPCLTLMLAFDEPVGFREPFLSPSEGPLAWIARNNSKPGRSRSPETVVVHATPEWSREHINVPLEQITESLLQSVCEYTGPATPAFRMAHRWLYARVEQAAEVACLWDPVQRVGACGDWALGPRVECAFDSGVALAAAIIGTDR